jgi:hypothetical protein
MAMARIVSEALIAQRAFAIWEREGRPHGRDREHWSQACEELSGRALVSGKKVPKTPRAVATVRVPKGPKPKPSPAVKGRSKKKPPQQGG